MCPIEFFVANLVTKKPKRIPFGNRKKLKH